MAWTTPVDQVTGFLVTAVVYNSHLVDNLLYLHGDSASAPSILRPHRTPRITIAYSASITPDASAGDWQTIGVSNATAFTINAPTNPPAASEDQWLTIEIVNNSGGAMGVITWNAVFLFVLGVWANPSSTKRRMMTFKWNGNNWIAQTAPCSDY